MEDRPRTSSRTQPPEPTTTEDVQKILARLRLMRGFHDDYVRAQYRRTSNDFQIMVEEVAEEARQETGDAIRLSTQSFSSPFRCIYELIQNADDAKYSKRSNNEQAPFVKFTIRPAEITIESNEDGFTVDNVYAICKHAQSTKKNDQSTTGEKGLGFKSVFRISSLVHIQSGLWSFQFVNDNGLGMVTPHWVDSEALRDGVRTKITLSMTRTDDDFRRESTTAFDKVPNTALLFLRQLESLEFAFEGDDMEPRSHIFKRGDQWNDETRSIAVYEKGEWSQLLYIMRSGSNFVQPKYQSDQPNIPATQPTKVELAFPICQSTGKPRLSASGEHAFSYLPMNRMAPLKFIIQSDFDTVVSRETVLKDSRNEALRTAVASLFADAVEKFCIEFPGTLRYTWTHYVPRHDLEDFWKPLRNQILDKLSAKHLLETRTRDRYSGGFAGIGASSLRRISDVRAMPSVFQHQGDPLFQSDLLLSDKYDENSIIDLQCLGLPVLSKKEMLDCVKIDLNPTSGLFGTRNSTIKSTKLSDEWHTTLAEFLLDCICPDETLSEQLKWLAVLPVSHVSGVTWISPAEMSSRPIYWPTVDIADNAPSIDPEIGLLTIHPEAYADLARREFYNYWNIGHVNVNVIVTRVVQRNRAATHPREARCRLHYVKHFAILFWHWDARQIMVGPNYPLWAAATNAPNASTFGGATHPATSNMGTAHTPFRAYIETIDLVPETWAYQSVTFQRPYTNDSFEELRLVDYGQGRRFGNNYGQTGAVVQNTALDGFGTFNSTNANTGVERILPSHRLYHRSKEEYSTYQLLQGEIDHREFGFLHEDYISSEYVKRSVKYHRNGRGQFWWNWLVEVAGVRVYPELESPGFPGVSPVFREIVEKAPSKVIKTLDVHWKEYKAIVRNSARIRDDLKDALVQCRNGDKHKLSQTILPTEATLGASQDFGVESEMPFLHMDEEPQEVIEADWAFLFDFGVCMRPSLDLSLKALKHLINLAIGVHEESNTSHHAVAVYESIASFATTVEDRKQLRQFFSTHSAIYASYRWVHLKDCVWKGPVDFSIAKIVLEQTYTVRGIAARDSAYHLFTNLLGMRNATYRDYLQAIQISKNNNPRVETLRKMYQALDDTPDSGNADICARLEGNSLVLGKRGWVPLSSCVWNSAISSSGRTVLSELYPSLKRFFVDRMGVKSMSAAIILAELIEYASADGAEPKKVKAMLRETAYLLSTEEMTHEVKGLLKRLTTAKFLPTFGPSPSDTPSLVSTRNSFLIVDDQQLGDAFRGKVRLLDFAANERILMRPLFKALRLDDSYLSDHVKTVTNVEESKENAKLTNDMRQRSFYISCCAMSHNSSYVHTERHAQLLACEVHISDAMTTTFNVKQDQTTATVKRREIFLNITPPEKEQPLKICVPEDDTQRQRCYRAHLSKEMMKFLDIVVQPAERQLHRILNDRLSALDNVLSEEGIPMIPDIFPRPPLLNEDESEQASIDVAIVETESATSHWNQGRRETNPLPPNPIDRPVPEKTMLTLSHLSARYTLATENNIASNDESLVEETESALPFSTAGSGHTDGVLLGPGSLFYDDFSSNVDDPLPGSYSRAQYRTVLRHIVSRARAAKRFCPGQETFNLSAINDALPQPTPADLGIVDGQKTNRGVFRLIGAAGELFVFERLRACGLHALVRADWQSRIRHLVRDHPEYEDMEQFREREEADIMYDDHDGKMEDLLRQERSSQLPTWAPPGSSDEKPIQFMVEVKTTINKCNEPFIVSQHQYELLSKHALAPGETIETPRVVYVIARVYNLLSADIGVKFFIDPKRLERDNILHFRRDSWKVTPQT